MFILCKFRYFNFPRLQPWETYCRCGRSDHANAIVASIYEMVESDDTRLLICLGTILSHHHVLTSKHCFGSTESVNFKFFISFLAYLKLV